MRESEEKRRRKRERKTTDLLGDHQLECLDSALTSRAAALCQLALLIRSQLCSHELELVGFFLLQLLQQPACRDAWGMYVINIRGHAL